MRPVLSRAQIREFDRAWMERGVPGMVLMENAGRGAAHLIGLKIRPRRAGQAPRQGSNVAGSCVRCADERALMGARVLVLAGAGNNGGDGYVVARHLSARGAEVRVFGLAGPEELRGDAFSACAAMQAAGVPLWQLPEPPELASEVAEADVVVDALLGTGLGRPLSGALRTVIEQVNAAPTPVIALDIPSGLDADTGAVLGVAIEAVHTVTFAHLKRGLLTTLGQAHGGSITVSHIGVPSELPAEMAPVAWLLEESDLVGRIAARSPVAHKGTAGRVVLVAGSPGTVGAARLAARACLRAGAGLVTLASDPLTKKQLDGEVVEIMTHALGDRAADEVLLGGAGALVVGPGLGNSAGDAIEQALGQALPTVLDADALRFIAGSGRTAFARQSPSLCVLTPHPGEAGALLGTETQAIEADRFAAATRIAEELHAVVVLKGSRSIIAAPGKAPVVSAFGSPALATAGSGDVLSGILGAFLVGAGSLDEVFVRTQTAVAVHALAGERWAEAHGDRGLLASEIADLVPEVLDSLVVPAE